VRGTSRAIVNADQFNVDRNAVKKLDRLNPLARKMANALFAAFPAFERRFKPTPKGDLIAQIVAPKGSRALGIQVCTIGGRDVWVQFGVANAFCYVESERELVEIVTGLTEERLRFAINSRKGRWTSSCLLRGREKIKLKRGETGAVYSWTGKKDIQDA
jgi:hypothetical protein